jgi:hypothetical protein
LNQATPAKMPDDLGQTHEIQAKVFGFHRCNALCTALYVSEEYGHS